MNPVKQDPAGLDNLLLAAGKACHDFVATKAARFGVQLDWWNGPEGLKGVIEDAIREHEVPNKRFQELVTPRKLAEHARVIRPRKTAGKRRLAR